jgi:hypothetical protein
MAIYIAWRAAGQAMITRRGSVDGADLMVIELDDGQNQVEYLNTTNPAEKRVPAGGRCQRVYSAGGTTVCLRVSGIGPTFEARVTDADGQVVRTVPVTGTPSRARVSASGRIVSWTTFMTGDSYSVPGGFSTRTGVLDLHTGELVESLEGFRIELDGTVYTSPDVNFWGVTVAADDRTFYATLASGGRTWLVQGDLSTRSVRAVRAGAECPSLSPDGREVAYKRRVNRLGPWQLVVLDLAAGQERVLPGTKGIDDQAAWLPGNRLAYAAVPSGGGPSSVFVVPADGSRPGEVLVPNAMSPVPLQQGGESAALGE